MSFSSEIKKELSKINNLTKKNLLEIELIGYLISINTIDDGKIIKYSTENEYNINRLNKLLLNLNIEYDIQIQGKIYSIEFKKEKCKINKKDEYTEDEEKSLIRGAFLGGGSINEPTNNYHLEIILKEENSAKNIQEILKKYNISVKKFKRKKGYSLYCKDGEEISKILAFIGANKAVLKYEEIRVVKEARNNINRIVNCETANLNKTIDASVKQVEAIKKIINANKFETMPDNLKEIANLRLENPEASLVELGNMLKTPIGKSGVNHRLKKIEQLAMEI